MIPQIIILALALIMLMFSDYKHGQPKEGKWNFWGSLFVVTINLLILYWGGFFNVFFK
jgi:hypothetical protein